MELYVSANNPVTFPCMSNLLEPFYRFATLLLGSQSLAHPSHVMDDAGQRKWLKRGDGCAQAVVVVPSRELAMQIVRVGQSLLPHGARGCVQQAIGGANMGRQVLSCPSF